METLASWLAVPVAVVLVGAVASVRVVTEHHRAVVTRLGRTHRVAGPGVVFHLPLLERVASVSLRAAHTVVAVPRPHPGRRVRPRDGDGDVPGRRPGTRIDG